MNVMKKLGEYTPAFGMVGTLVGLVMMLYGMGAGESENMAAKLGLSMAVALITTLYGALFANFLFLGIVLLIAYSSLLIAYGRFPRIPILSEAAKLQVQQG